MFSKQNMSDKCGWDQIMLMLMWILISFPVGRSQRSFCGIWGPSTLTAQVWPHGQLGTRGESTLAVSSRYNPFRPSSTRSSWLEDCTTAGTAKPVSSPQLQDTGQTACQPQFM